MPRNQDIPSDREDLDTELEENETGGFGQHGDRGTRGGSGIPGEELPAEDGEVLDPEERTGQDGPNRSDRQQ